MLLLAALTALAAPCGTALGHRPPAPPPAPPTDHKGVRDALGADLHVHETENFAVKWGDTAAFDDDDVVALGEALEAAWVTEITQYGYPSPEGSAAFKLNVYAGDTDGAPSSYGNSGYFTWDPEGYPMIVVAAAKIRERDVAARTAAHELFHAVQDAAGAYDWETGVWWYEATAVWMEAEVRPDDPATASFVARFAFLPELPLSFFDYPDTGAWQEYHHYGAFLFARHLSEREGPEIVRETLVGATGTPVEAIDAALGGGMAASFVDFAGRNATFDDYDHGGRYLEWIDHYGGWDSDFSHRPTGTIDGTSGWEAPDEGPRGLGAHYWRWVRWPEAARVQVEGDVHARVAVRRGAGTDLYDVGDGVEILTDDAREAWIVVAATGDEAATHDYRLRIDRVPVGSVDDTGEVPGEACGCESAPAPWLAALIPLAATRRRRARSR